MLSDTAARNAKPRGTPYKLFDSRGLYLVVTPSGGKWWRFKFRVEGKEKLLSLGTYPDIGVKAARQRLATLREQLAQGIDPGAQRKIEKREAASRRDNSFRALAETWYTKKAPSWAAATARKTRLYLDRDLLPALGDRPITEIRRPELVEVLRRFEKRNAHNVAKKARQWLSGIFRFGLAAGVLEANPATDLDVVAAPAPQAKRHAHLPLKELPTFLRVLQSYGGEPATQAALWLLLMTAVRPGELRFARWEEFDLDVATWQIPAERMKMRRPHVVPLPVQAVAILRDLHRLTGTMGLVFAGRDDPGMPFSENTLNSAIRRLGYKGRQTGHGFRHVVSTALNERGYNRDWIERQLAHGDADQIRGVYNSAEYFEQRRKMMQAWADELDAMGKGRPVIAGRFGRSS